MHTLSVTSRRTLLRRALGVAVVLPATGLLAACGAASTAATASSAAPTTAAVASSAAPAASSAAATTQAVTTQAAVSSTASPAATTSKAASTSAAASAASSATTSAAPTVKPGVAGTLTWMVEFSGAMNEKRYDDFLKPWNDTHPNAKAEPFSIGGGDADKYEKILTLAAAGTPLDLIGKVTFIQAIAKPGAIQPLEPFLNQDKYDITGYNQGWLKTFGTWNGKLYSLPWGLGGNALAFIYNPNMIAAAGLKPPSQDWKNPWGWDDYRDYALKLTKKQGTTYQVVGAEELGDWDYTIPMQWGAHWVSPDFTKAICNSPEMVQAFTKYLDMILKDQTSMANPAIKVSGDSNTTRWAAGQTALSFIGGWEMNFFTDPSQYKNDYVAATFPKGTASSPDQDTIQLAIGAGIKDPPNAWGLMQWLLADGKYANLVYRMPALSKDAASWSKTAFSKVSSTAGVDVIVNSLATAQAPDPVRAIPANARFEKDIASPLWDNMLKQKVTVQDGLAQAQQQLQTLLDTTK